MYSVTVLKKGSDAKFRRISTADCHFFESLLLSDQICEMTWDTGQVGARPGIIEVNDEDAPLHQHWGLTICYVIEGHGIIKTDKENLPIEKGDTIIIPANSLHASVAAPGTKLVEYSVFIGYVDDFSAVEAE